MSGVRGELHATPSETRLPSDIESHLFRIVQESLNNVSKHAQASRVSVLIERRPDEVRLIIEDDGCGFDLDEVRRHSARGMGLAGMHERAASIGAGFQIESAAGQGTTLFVRAPLTRRSTTR